jgi:16S rRNA (guanine966-N2)-methyltransferase
MDIRPTSDRLRETLFNVLTAGNPDALVGTVWLDLFAGTGAVGIEALSRGAREVHFVESSAAAAQVIRKNLQSLAILEGFKLVQHEIPNVFGRMARDGFVADLVFLDPPYRMKDIYARTLQSLAESSLIGANSVVTAEHEKKFDPGEAFGSLRRFRILEQGNTALSFYQLRIPGEN